MTTQRPDKQQDHDDVPGTVERPGDTGQPGTAGMPGDGAGQREEPGRTGVHPASAGWPEGDMAIVREGEWGQGERGLAGYEDAGESEISPAGAEASAGGGSLIEQPDRDDAASSRSPSGGTAEATDRGRGPGPRRGGHG